MPSLLSAGCTEAAKASECRSASSRAVCRVFCRISLDVRPLVLSTGSPAAIRRIRPATRTMKNSSRLLAKMARNRTRSSSGTVGVLGQLEHPLVEPQPALLAVEEPVGRQPAAAPTPAAPRAPSVPPARARRWSRRSVPLLPARRLRRVSSSPRSAAR